MAIDKHIVGLSSQQFGHIVSEIWIIVDYARHTTMMEKEN
jgi:hypothetical protein